MKPSDLSIGDWVQVIGTEKRVRIKEMIKFTTWKGEELTLGVEGGEFYRFSSVIPVPIDGEILKKNGFSGPDSSPMFTHSYGGSKTEPAEEEIEIVYDLTHNEWTGEFFGPEGLAMQVRIRYVHELQRIMRCMGIDHDIVV